MARETETAAPQRSVLHKLVGSYGRRIKVGSSADDTQPDLPLKAEHLKTRGNTPALLVVIQGFFILCSYSPDGYKVLGVK